MTELTALPAQYFYLPALSTFAANFLVFLLAIILQDNSIVDIMWGILFIIPNAVALYLTDNWNKRTLLTFALVCIWGFRLALHIGTRHKGEDYRYAAWRRAWMQRGKYYFYFRSFYFVFMMQAFFSLVVNSSALLVSLTSPSEEFTILDYVGAGVWIIGFAFELIGDWQLQKFRDNPDN